MGKLQGTRRDTPAPECTCAGPGHTLCLCGGVKRAPGSAGMLSCPMSCLGLRSQESYSQRCSFPLGKSKASRTQRGSTWRPGQSCSLKQADLPEVGHDFPNNVKQGFGAEGGLTSLPQSTEGLPEFFHQGTAEGKQHLFLERKQALNESSPYITGQLTTGFCFFYPTFFFLHSVTSDSQRLL